MSAKCRPDRVKLATVFPTSMVLKKGLDPTTDPEQITVNQQIEQLRGRYFYLESRYQGLIATFHLLTPVLKNDALRKRLENEGKQTATSLVATALFEACILDCYTILIDSKEINPSLCTLCRPFLQGNRARHVKLLNRLASLYSDRQPYWPDASIINPFTPKEIAAWKTKNKRANAGRRGAFQRIVNRLSRDWGTLAKASQELPAFRTNFVAHLILEYDEPTNRFRIADLPNPKELCATIEKLIPIITRSVANLAIILGVGTDSLNLFGHNAKKNAAIFWNLKTVRGD